jgi:hypothetical protein
MTAATARHGPILINTLLQQGVEYRFVRVNRFNGFNCSHSYVTTHHPSSNSARTSEHSNRTPEQLTAHALPEQALDDEEVRVLRTGK